MTCSIVVSAAGPLSLSVYAPVSRFCAMKSRMANGLLRMLGWRQRNVHMRWGVLSTECSLSARFRCNSESRASKRRSSPKLSAKYFHYKRDAGYGTNTSAVPAHEPLPRSIFLCSFS